MTTKRFCIRLLIVLSVIIFNYSPALGKPVRILILPFDVNSDKDLSFLKQGVGTMLSTRLAQEGKVLPLGEAAVQQAVQGIPGPFDETKAYQLGAQADVEYVVFGTITVFGDSVSTDARFLDIRNQKPVVTFSQFGKNQGDVLYHINLFAGEVNEKAFGRKTYVYRKSETPESQTGAETSRRKHPDTLIRTDRKGSPLTMGLGQSGVWRSRRYKSHLNGVAVGDVDGDGNNETVFVGSNRLFIHRYVEGRFEKIKEIAGRQTDKYISLDVADINQNGIPEIFVTNYLEDDRKLSSFVLEWTGKAFKRITSGKRWYYRVLTEDGKEPVLLGQKRGIDYAFSSGVNKMKWQGGTYEPMDRLKLPKNTIIYGFTFGDAMNNGQDHLVTYSRKGKLRMFDPEGREIWKSKDRYGGSTIYVEYPMEYSASIGEHKEMDRYYLPLRVHVTDVDQDGKKEVVAVKNQDIAGSRIRRFRYYENGLIEGLAWDQIGLRQIWTTREFSGPILDFIIADMDNDKQVELVLSVSADSNPMMGNEKGYIVMMEVVASEKK